MGQSKRNRRRQARRTRAGWRSLTPRESRITPGQAPGKLQIPEQALPPCITLLRYGPDGVEERELGDLGSPPAASVAGKVTWIDVQGIGDEATMQRLGQWLGIHPLALADMVHVPQRPKVDAYDDRLLVILRMAQHDHDRTVVLEQVSLVLGPGWLLTVQEDPGDVFDLVRARIRTGAGTIRRLGADYLAYALVDAVVDGYFAVAESIGEEVDRLEELVLRQPDSTVLLRVHELRRMLLALHRVQWRQRDAITALLREEHTAISPAVRLFLRDTQDHSVQVLDVIETTRELVVGLMEVYLSLSSNRMNEIMKTLTVIATIFIPLTFIVGVYGMNFHDMPELDWPLGYYAVWAVMLGITAAQLLWFRSRGWLQRSRSRDLRESMTSESGESGAPR